MKKWLSLIIAVMLCMGISTFSAYADDYVDVVTGTCGQNVSWTCEIKFGGTLEEEATLTISGTGPMTDFSNSGYHFCSDNKIKEVIIENGVTHIGNNAFSVFESLETVTIPDSVTSIGNSAFYCCQKLTTVKMSKNVSALGKDAFHDTSITDIVLPNNLSVISDGAFAGCKKLANINMPSSLTDIGDYAFNGCKSMKGLSLPDGVKNIGKYAFSECTSLTKIGLPSGLTSMGEFAFAGCSAAAGTVTIPSGIKEISRRAFDQCSSLNSVILQKGIQRIEEGAFCKCSSISGSITVPDTVTDIGHYAFSCYSLKSITIPASVTHISSEAFYGCNSTTIYGYNGTEAQYIGTRYSYLSFVSLDPVKADEKPASGTKKTSSTTQKAVVKAGTVFKDNKTKAKYKVLKGLKTVTYMAPVSKTIKTASIPATVKYAGKTFKVTGIAANAFKSASKLTTVSIGINVKNIGKTAFYNCKKLKKITIKSGVLKTVGTNAFKGIYAKATIKVPAKKLSAYKKLLKKKGIGKKVRITK